MIRRAVVAVAVLAALIPVSARAQALTSPSVTAPGRASVTISPDMAWLTTTIETRAVRTADAQAQAAQRIEKLRAALRAAGVADAAVKTHSYTVEPVVDYASGRSTVVGYAARHALEIRVDVLADLGTVIDAAGGAGASAIADIRYDAKGRAEAEAEALRRAVQDGMRRAELMASAAGRSVQTVWRIEDQRGGSPGPRPVMAMAKAAVETSIAPAPLEIEATVLVTVILR